MKAPRILIVTDDVIAARHISARLVRSGFDVAGVCAKGEEALQLAIALRPSLVLVDNRLCRGMDAAQVANAIRSTLGLPVDFLSPYAEGATWESAAAAEPPSERDLADDVKLALTRHEMESKCRASELRFTSAMQSLRDAVLTIDSDRNITFVNAAAEAILGLGAAELLGEPLSEAVRLVVESTGQMLVDMLDAPQIAENRCVLLASDGREIAVELTVAPIHAESGMADGAIVVLRDIREIRQLEAQLRHSRKMEVMGRLVGGVAHDFNNLVSVMNGHAELLADIIGPRHALSTNLNEIRKAGAKAVDLTKRLLTACQLQAARPCLIDVNALVQQSWTTLRGLVGEHITLRAELGYTTGCVKVEPGHLEQVLVHLTIDARDGMRSGGELKIQTDTVTLSEKDEVVPHLLQPGVFCRIQVSDNGGGMDEATRARAFEPFVTGNAPDRGSIGLAVAYAIVELCGGHLFVENTLAKRTTYTILLPQVVEPSRDWPSADPTQFLRGSETVLLVEDDDSVRGLLRQFLESFGYQVLEACNGKHALAVSSQFAGAIDLLLTDIAMPEMNGRTLANVLVQSRPRVKTLFISGYAAHCWHTSESVERDEVLLAKPIGKRDLASRIRSILDDCPQLNPSRPC
jgi:two-component system, cell cycle sensor histidine kinase and response regulator CckA